MYGTHENNFWNALSDVERLWDDIGQALAVHGSRFTLDRSTAINIWTNQDALVVTAEVPGVDPESVGISVLNDLLTITGQRSVPAPQAGANAKPTFTRTIELPHRVDADRTEARCRDGVLTIILQRPDAEKPRKIPVKMN